MTEEKMKQQSQYTKLSQSTTSAQQADPGFQEKLYAQFINQCCHSASQARSVTEIRSLIEERFEKDFKPERDQIQFMRSKQKSKYFRRQYRHWTKLRNKNVLKQKHMDPFYNQTLACITKDDEDDDDDEQDKTDPESSPESEEQEEKKSHHFKSPQVNPLEEEKVSGEGVEIGVGNTRKSSHQIIQERLEKDIEIGYFERSKKIGRIGPIVTELNTKGAYGEIKQHPYRLTTSDQKDFHETGPLLDIEAKSAFVSIRANTAVFKGCFFYEVLLLTDGLMQIGWCQLNTEFSNTDGVGDDKSSYAYDGNRVKKWNGANSRYGEQWAVGDVISTMIDLKNRDVMFWRNGTFLGTAFTNIEVGENKAYFPAISMEKGQRAQFNFGLRPFSIRTNFFCLPLNEADSLINNYYYSAVYILDMFKDFIMAFKEKCYESLSDERKLIIGSILLEYLAPLMEDTYVLDNQVVQFLNELIIIGQKDLVDTVFKVFEIHFSPEQLKDFMPKVFHIVCRKLMEQSLANCNFTQNKFNIDSTYLILLTYLVQKDEFLYAWMASSGYFQDLEMVYALHLPTADEWQSLLEKVYHKLLPVTHGNRVRFEENYSQLESQFDRRQEYLVQITDILLDSRPRKLGPPVKTTTGEAQFSQLVPQEEFLNFMNYLTGQSKKYHGENQSAYSNYLSIDMNNAAIKVANTMANVFVCATANSLHQIVLKYPLEDFPIHCFFMRENTHFDQRSKNRDRLGGTLTHLETELHSQLTPFKNIKLAPHQLRMLNFVKAIMEMFSCGLLDHAKNLQGILEKIYIRHRTLDDLSDDCPFRQKDQISQEMTNLVQQSPTLKLVFLSPLARDSIHRFSTWLMAVSNALDDSTTPLSRGGQGLVYILPELFVDIPYEMFRIFKRADSDLYQNSVAEQQKLYTGCLRDITYQSELARFISMHFFDPKIANPDLKEVMIIRLNMLLQYQDLIKTLESDSSAQNFLVPLMLESLGDRRWLCHTVKNLLRLSKGQGFKEITYSGIGDSTYSEYFLEKLRNKLLSSEDEATKQFMHSVFSAVNDVTSELFMVLKETPANQLQGRNSSLMRRAKFYQDMIIDLCRVLEMLSKWVPELFLVKDQIHATRLLDYICFVLRSIFTMEMDKLLVDFCSKLQTKSRTLPQFLAPFIGILVNLYTAISVAVPSNSTSAGSVTTQISQSLGAISSSQNANFDGLADLFNRMDSFDSNLFSRLKELVINQLPAKNEAEVKIFASYSQMLQETEMLMMCNKIQKGSADSNKSGGAQSKNAFNGAASGSGLEEMKQADSGEAEQEIDDEKLCQICFNREMDTEYTPCSHTSCKICIQTHMLSNKRCPFCQEDIAALKPIQV